MVTLTVYETLMVQLITICCTKEVHDPVEGFKNLLKTFRINTTSDIHMTENTKNNFYEKNVLYLKQSYSQSAILAVAAEIRTLIYKIGVHIFLS